MSRCDLNARMAKAKLAMKEAEAAEAKAKAAQLECEWVIKKAQHTAEMHRDLVQSEYEAWVKVEEEAEKRGWEAPSRRMFNFSWLLKD